MRHQKLPSIILALLHAMAESLVGQGLMRTHLEAAAGVYAGKGLYQERPARGSAAQQARQRHVPQSAPAQPIG